MLSYDTHATLSGGFSFQDNVPRAQKIAVRQPIKVRRKCSRYSH